ncbi:MAG: hypothetical protein WBX01_14510 [Nitrososphaeraceae archaeon]
MKALIFVAIAAFITSTAVASAVSYVEQADATKGRDGPCQPQANDNAQGDCHGCKTSETFTKSKEHCRYGIS